jgi:subtilase family serine protease
VRAIKLNGQAPDGKDDCKVGRNDVIVVVKCSGKGDASSFTVRLAVDGDNHDSAVDGVAAGREREVRFDNVQLKKGDHALAAVADPEHAISETREENNELKASARCQG